MHVGGGEVSVGAGRSGKELGGEELLAGGVGVEKCAA